MRDDAVIDDAVVVARLRSAGCVFAEDEAALLRSAARTPEELAELVGRRAAGEPLEQVVGWAEFAGLRIGVDPGVFVPRRRSEFLVSVAVGLAGSPTGGGRAIPVIVDLCCGTGALGLAVATGLAGRAELHAADLDPAAVACARRNLEPVGAQVYVGDLFGALPRGLRGRADVLICNAPYVPTADVAFLPAEARDHEPLVALDGGLDGLAILRRAASDAPQWLAPGGVLLVETSDRQAPEMAAAMAAAGLSPSVRGDEERGATVVTGVRLAVQPLSGCVSGSVSDPGHHRGEYAALCPILLVRRRAGGPLVVMVDSAEELRATDASAPEGVAEGAEHRTVRDTGFRSFFLAAPDRLEYPVRISVSVAQRRARLVERHRLAVAAACVVEAVDAMIALHGTDPTAVYLSAWARTGCAAEQLDEAVYVERSLVRMLGMRRTMFVVPAGLVPVVQAGCTDDVARRLRRQLEKDLGTGGIGDGDPGGWLREVESGVLGFLHARGGGASGAQLSEGEPRLRTQLSVSPDKSYGGTFNITSRVLTLLGAEGLLVRGHRRGGWSSGQYEWFATSDWLGGPAGPGGPDGDGVDGGVRADGSGLDGGAARVELARRWLRLFGPAPASDLQWWGGWTGGQTKAALSALPTVPVDLDGQPGVALADDLEFPAAVAPVASLLPALDPTPMGWQARDWFLGQHRAVLFDRTGNIGPTAWWQGRVVGGWAQRASGEIVLRLLEDIGADGAAAVSGAAARLEAWLGANRVTPRFRTPLERELSA